MVNIFDYAKKLEKDQLPLPYTNKKGFPACLAGNPFRTMAER
jgi:hypothetical protein